MQFWRLGLLLFLIAPTVFAVEEIDLTIAVPGVAMIVIAVLVIAQMMATATSNPRLTAWSKREIQEFIVGILLVAIIIAFFTGGVPGVSIALTGNADYSEAAQTILDGWIGGYTSAFEYIIIAASRIRAAATYAPYLNIPLWYVSINYSTNPLAGIGILLGSLNMATSGLTNAIFIAEGIRMMIGFMKATGPTVLLPVAFIARLIPFTRKTGNTLISIVISGMVFLPFGVIFADVLNSSIDMPNPTMDTDNLTAKPWAMTVFEPMCQTKPLRLLLSLTDPLFALVVCLPLYLIPVAGPGLFAACFPVVQNVVYPIINIVFQLAGAALMLAWEGLFGTTLGAQGYVDDVWGELYPFLRDVNNLVLVGYLDFVFIGIVTMAGARSISSVLGGEWYMAGVQRLI